MDDLTLGQGELEVMDVLQVGTFPRGWKGGSAAVVWGNLTLRRTGEAGKLPES